MQLVAEQLSLAMVPKGKEVTAPLTDWLSIGSYAFQT